MSTDIYYVQAQQDASGLFAACSYFLDKAATQPVSGTKLRIPTKAGACLIAQADNSALVLLGTVYKTLGLPPSLNNSNYTPADDEGTVSIPMPTREVVTKGLVLLFSDPVKVTALYPSSDPEVTNTEN